MSFSKEITGFRFSSKQFVCAASKEPVFRVSGNLGGKTSDHFSHYRKRSFLTTVPNGMETHMHADNS